jgi:ubiquinone/menaquinone biosynthesis C-methylase UbiE
MEPIDRIRQYYEEYDEDHRLNTADGSLEYQRTKEIISGYLPKTRQSILDVGGANGPYSFWLSSIGHEVHLLDPVHKHIRIASERNSKASQRLSSIILGAATELPFHDQRFDCVLLMGPLYHIQDQNDRSSTLREVNRVLKPKGFLFSTYITRFASLLDGYRSNLIVDPEYQSIVFDDLATGKHRGSVDGTAKYFTHAYLHHPDEIENEVQTAGFSPIELIAIESFGWMIPNLSKYWDDPHQKQVLLSAIALVEKEKSLIGISPHVILISRKNHA